METGCEAIGDSKWKVNPSSGLGSDMCDFDCNDGYKKDGRSCYESPEARDLTELANNVSKVIGEERRSYKVGTGYGPWSVASCIGGYHANSGNTNCVSNDCSSEIGDGSGARTVAGGTCQITSCAVDYYDSGVSDCEQVADGEWSAGNSKAKADCTGKPSDSGYTTRGGGVATGCSWACNGGYTEDSGSCHKTEDTCSDSGAHIATGTKTYSKGTGYGSCEPTSCASNYHIESGSCVSDSDGCVIVNGAGGKKWDGDASSWGACEAISCGGGYDAQGDSEVCGETPSGYYSLVGSTERLSCSTVETLVGNSGWSSATGLAKGSECEWECNLGYKKNAAENDCISSESIDRFIITNAISVGKKGARRSQRRIGFFSYQ